MAGSRAHRSFITGRRALSSIGSFVTKQPRSIHVLMIVILVLLAAAGVLRFVFTDSLIWFFATTVVAALELLAVATIDLVADYTRRLPHLITDQRSPWPAWFQALLAPICLLIGILVDHLLVH